MFWKHSRSQQEGLDEEMGDRGLFVTCTVALDMICVLSKVSIYLSIKMGSIKLLKCFVNNKTPHQHKSSFMGLGLRLRQASVFLFLNGNNNTSPPHLLGCFGGSNDRMCVKDTGKPWSSK